MRLKYRVFMLLCKDLYDTHLVGLHWALLHVKVPYFDSQVVSGEQITSTMAELNIRNWRDDLREERPIAWIFWLLKDWGREKIQIQTEFRFTWYTVIRVVQLLSAWWVSIMFSFTFYTLAVNHQVFSVNQSLLGNGFNGFTVNDGNETFSTLFCLCFNAAISVILTTSATVLIPPPASTAFLLNCFHCVPLSLPLQRYF